MNGHGGRKPEERPKSRSLAELAHLWLYVRRYPLQLVGAVIALVVAAGTVLAMGAGLHRMVDEGFVGNNVELLDKAVLVLIGVTVLLAASSFARFFLVSWIGERVVADIRRRVFDHVITLSPAYFETTRTGEVLSRLTTDTTILQVVVDSTVSIAMRNALLLVGGSVLLIVTSPKLTGLVFLVVPLVLLPILIFGRKVRRLSRMTQDRVADVGAYVNESVGEIRTLQAFGHEPVDRRSFGARVEETFRVAVKRIRARALLTAAVIVLAFGAISIILWIGGHDVLAGRITPGELSAFVFYSIVVAGAVGALSEVVGDLQRAAGAMERLLELLATKPEIDAPEQPRALPTPGRGAVAFRGVTFRYPARPEQKALVDFDLEILPGEKTALVGPSGAGKSTVFQLLLRFYDPQAGAVLLDGVDLREADPKQLRARIGLVSQEPVLFSENVLENIRYGRPEASEAEVLAAAETANARDFIEQLPEGFGTQLGERGMMLSGGQRQRIALARAVLRDPSVLLLDEATSALDAESERTVQQALDRLMAGRTTLVVAHRLATVLKADRILVLDKGRVVETGRHADLVSRGGLYARLAALQFEDAEQLRNGGSEGLPSEEAAAG